MKNQNCWSFSSKSLEPKKSDDLTILAGRWNGSLQVRISIPSKITKGPIIEHFTNQQELSSDIIPRVFE